MKRFITKVAGSALFLALTVAGYQSNAQSTTLAAVNTKSTSIKQDASNTAPETKAAAKPAEDTSWKPQRRVWGYAFGDFYYAAHTDQNTGARGSEHNYAGVPTYRNAFQFRRIYLGYDYEINKKFKAEFLLASEPSANTGVNGITSIQNGDNLVDGKMGLYIKNINIRVREIWSGTDLVVGEMATPGFAMNEPGTNGPSTLAEANWGNRFLEKTVADLHKTNSYDVGAALEGTFDPSTKNFGYVFMVGNNSQASLLSAANPNTGFYKIFYGDIWGKFFNKHLLVDIYADNVRTAPATADVPGQSHGMWKASAAYLSSKFSVGVEAYTQSFTSGVTNTATKAPEDATAQALSIWVKVPLVKDKLTAFGRYDGYNPNTNFVTANSYTTNTNFSSYNPTNKETFYTAGLDFTPAKNIHFAPNFWLVNFKDQRDPSVTGYVAPDHTLVYRLTFYYVFGK